MICEIAQQAGRAWATRICLSVNGSIPGRPVGTQDDKGTVGTTCSRVALQKSRSQKIKVIMSRLLKSFEDLSLKVVAVRTAADSDIGFEFPAAGPQLTPSALTTPPEQSAERRRDPVRQYPGWYHGGIND